MKVCREVLRENRRLRSVPQCDLLQLHHGEHCYWFLFLTVFSFIHLPFTELFLDLGEYEAVITTGNDLTGNSGSLFSFTMHFIFFTQFVNIC